MRPWPARRRPRWRPASSTRSSRRCRSSRDLAGRQAAARRAGLRRSPTRSTSLGPVPPASNTFWMTADDKVLAARTDGGGDGERHCQRMAVGGIRPRDAGLRHSGAAAARQRMARGHARSDRAEPAANPQSRGWSVAYGDLDELIADSPSGPAWSTWAMTSSCRKSSRAARGRASSSARVRSL